MVHHSASWFILLLPKRNIDVRSNDKMSPQQSLEQVIVLLLVGDSYTRLTL